jgi:hypothetical protein
MGNDDANVDFQKNVLQALRAQQQAYLEAVKAWRDQLSKGAMPPLPTWPELKPPPTPPSAAEMVEASYAFAAKLLAEQSRFMEELGKAMAAPKSKP